MDRRTREFVGEHYATLRRCLQAYGRFATAGKALAGEVQQRGKSQKRASYVQVAEKYDVALAELEAAVSASRDALEELGPLPGAIGDGIARFGAESAASLAEALVLHCEQAVELAQPAGAFTKREKKELFWLFQLDQVGQPTDEHPELVLLDISREEAKLDKEAAGFVALMSADGAGVTDLQPGLWRCEGDRVELFEGLDALPALPLALLCLLIRKRGRRVSYEAISDEVWGRDEDVQDQAIRDTKCRLVEKLEELGHPQVAKAICSVSSGYMLRHF